MTAFKVRLRVPPSAAKEDSGHRDDADTTMESVDLSADTSAVAVPAEGSAAVDDADDSVTGPTEQAEAVRSSEDVANEDEELVDEEGKTIPSEVVIEIDEKTKTKKKVRRASGPVPGSISAVAASLTLEELDALPSAKRRKGLKTRGAPGPGRGWRKGLSKGQKPVYRLPGSDISTADLPQNQNLPIHETTPSTFRSDAPRRVSSKQSASPAPSAPSEPPGPLLSSTIRVTQNSPDAVFKYPSIPSLREAPELLPLARVPNFIPPATTLERHPEQRTRHWGEGQREILSLGGRPWRAKTWLSNESAQVRASKPSDSKE